PMRLSPLGQSAVDQFDALGPWLDRLEASLAWAECLDAFVFEGHPHVEGAPSIDELCAQVEAGWGLDPKDEARVAPMLDGVVAAPLAVALGRRGVFGIEGRGRDTRVADAPQSPSTGRGSAWREDEAARMCRAL